MPPKEGNKKTPPREANNSPPSEGSGVVSYRLSKRSIKYHKKISRLNGYLFSLLTVISPISLLSIKLASTYVFRPSCT
ncbi:MAG: hypothetical protein LBC74_11800 [Planctomycetaceae bacterium]|nr:hypothetical protein [Planctomycetaceae bacterium]